MKNNSRARNFVTLAFTVLVAASGHAQPVVEAIMHSFANSPDGANPTTTPVIGKTDGALYGVTVYGGTNNNGGTIWKINQDGSGYRTLHSFSTNDWVGGNVLEARPFIIQGSDNVIYGTTPGHGGLINGDITTNGSVFKMNSDGGFFTVLHTFTSSDSAPLSLVQGRDGALYGAGSVIFKINTDGSGYTILHTFTPGTDGNGVFGALIQGTDGALYGTADNGGPNSHGTVFKYDTNGNFTVLHSFGSIASDGQQALCGLVQAQNGALYGMTKFGGSNNLGTVFVLNTDGSGYTNVHHFGSFTGDGAHPVFGSLAEGLGGVLFGMTSVGGANLAGTIFKMGLDGGGYNVLYSFTNGVNASSPYGGLVAGPATANTGILYGTTEQGGGNANAGTVFSVLVNPPVSITPISDPAGTNGTVVFWPQWAFNYTLQISTNLGSNWVTLSNAAPVVGVQLTNTPPAAYFRLIYQ